MDLTPCPVCHTLEIRGGQRVPCGCVTKADLTSPTSRFFPRQGAPMVAEITKPQFDRVGRCHHKKSDFAETMKQFKDERVKCIRDFGNCWRRIKHPEIT